MKTWKSTLLFPFSEKHQATSSHDFWAARLPRHVDGHLERSQGRQKSITISSQFDNNTFFWLEPVLLTEGCFSLIQSQPAKSSSDSEEVAETDRDEDGEEGKKEQEETEKEGKEKTEAPSEEDTKKHGFLILSREDSTMVDRHTAALV